MRKWIMVIAGLAGCGAALAAAPQETKESPSPQQVAPAMRAMKHTLVDSIRTAESAADGKAVCAHIDFQSGSPSQPRTCVVTICTDDQKFIEVTVDHDTNKVINQRNVTQLRAIGASSTGSTGYASSHAGEHAGHAMGGQDQGHGEHARTSGGTERWFAPPQRWQKASDLMGKTVKNDVDENLGEIKDLAIDMGNGRILYGAVAFGGVLGVGEKLFAVPWNSLDLPQDAKHFVLAVDKERLKNAEGFDKDHWPNICNERWASTTNKYYGQPPYWDITGGDFAKTESSTGTTGTGDTSSLSARQRWCRPASSWQKASDLIGKDVVNGQNTDIGDISDLAIDPDTGRVLYAIVSYSGRYVAVPWGAADLSSDAKYFQVDVSEQRMKEIGFPRDEWPNLASKSWGERAHTDFNRKPYWEEM